MNASFRRRCESALTHPAKLLGLVALITTILTGMVACEYETSFGATRVATTADGVAVETRRGGQAVRIAIYESKDGGLTWHLVSFGSGPRTFEWSDGRAVTPKEEYRIDGVDIVRVSDNNRVLETVYSAEYLQGHINKWVQGKATAGLGRRELSFGPSGIAYDEQSGNLIASMGIRGILN